MSVVPFSDRSQVTISGIDDGPLTLDVQKNEPVTSLKFKVSGPDSVVGIQINNDYGHFRWINCIETLQP